MIDLVRELGSRMVYILVTAAFTTVTAYLTYGPMIEYATACGIRRNQLRLCFVTTLWAWTSAAVHESAASECVARSWQDLAHVYASFSHEFPVAGCAWIATLLQLCPCLIHVAICGSALVRPGLGPSGWHIHVTALGLGLVTVLSLGPWISAGIVGFATLTGEGVDSELVYAGAPVHVALPLGQGLVARSPALGYAQPPFFNPHVLQTKSKLRVRDNSGRNDGSLLNAPRRGVRLGDVFTIAYSSRNALRHRRAGSRPTGRNSIGRALLVQSRQFRLRPDGSSVRFSVNGCVGLNRSSGGLSLGFRRITGTVPHELRRVRKAGLINVNLPRLARGAL